MNRISTTLLLLSTTSAKARARLPEKINPGPWREMFVRNIDVTMGHELQDRERSDRTRQVVGGQVDLVLDLGVAE